MQKEVKWFHFVGIFLALIIAAMISQGSLTGKAGYYDAGPGYYGRGYGPGFFGFSGGFLGGLSFSEIYFQYGYIVDAFLFLLIFLGLGRGVFGKHFSEGAKPLYTGVGIFLALALLLWEERTGYYLLVEFGSFVLILFLMVLIVYAFKWMKSSGAAGFTAFAFAYIIFFLFIYSGCTGLTSGVAAVPLEWLCDFLYQFNLDQILEILLWVAILGIPFSWFIGLRHKRKSR